MLERIVLKLLAMNALDDLRLRAGWSTILSRARDHGRLTHVRCLLLTVIREIIVHRVHVLILHELQLLERRREVNLGLKEFVRADLVLQLEVLLVRRVNMH